MERLHPSAKWLFFFQSIMGLLMLALFFSFMFVPIMFTEEVGTLNLQSIVGLVVLVFILIFLVISYIWAELTYKYWGYQLTDRAVKIEKGVIYKKYISIPYDRIQNVDIYRGLITRVFGLSDLQIQTAGYSGGRQGVGTEGRLPGLDPQRAEQLREVLIGKISKNQQGL